MGRISSTTKISDAKDCDVIVEVGVSVNKYKILINYGLLQAIIENKRIKLDFYKQLGPIIKPSAIFVSNTSSLPITEMSVASGRPQQFVGLHFFNPVQIMKLVEVIKTKQTSPQVNTIAMDFVKSIGKTAVSCGDTPGFIVNRLLIPYLASVCINFDSQCYVVGNGYGGSQRRVC